MDPQVLLLDEPTNHLDLAAIEWLEDWLSRYNGAFIAISHDRTFLTRLTRSSLWLDRGAIRRAEVGFGGFDAWTEKVFADEARNAERLDAKLKLEQHWLERGVTARRKRNQGRLTKLYEMRAVRAAMLGPPGAAKLGIENDDVKTRMVIDADKVTKSYGERAVIKDFTLRIQRGDRIGIVGANGAGKTTLLRLLTGEIAPDEGHDPPRQDARRRDHRPAAQIARSRQERARHRSPTAATGSTCAACAKHVQGYLKDFLFAPELVDAKIGTLSGGERSRLLLAREFARRSNLLVLDEPTNDLDLETLDLLQEVIADYEGTVLIVSHDRDFLDRTVTITLGLDGSGKVDIVAGGYEDWVRQRSAKAAGTARAKKAEAAARRPGQGADQAQLQGPARLRSAAQDDRGAGSRDPARRGLAVRSRPLHQAARALRRAQRRDREGARRTRRRRASLARTGRAGRGAGGLISPPRRRPRDAFRRRGGCSSRRA